MIERIIIDNYKSIQHASIDLAQLNVLIGANGAGKSNFISFFELTKALLAQRLGSYVLTHGGIDRLLHNGPKKSQNINGLIDFDNKNAFFFELKPTPAQKAFIEETGDYFNNRDDKEKNYAGAWHRKVWDMAVGESAILTNSQWRANYIRSFLKSFTVYHFHDTSQTSLMRRLCDTGDNDTLRADGSNLPAFLYRLSQKDNKTFRFIESTIRSIAPYFKRFVLVPDRIVKGSIALEWEETDSDMYLDATSFSDGTLRFIALTTLLLQPDPPATIIIDEPELGLHPAAINKLGAMIRRASHTTQVIIATQAVSVVDCFDPEDMIVVDRCDGQSTFDRLDPKRYGDWRDAYTLGQMWEKNIIGGQP